MAGIILLFSATEEISSSPFLLKNTHPDQDETEMRLSKN